MDYILGRGFNLKEISNFQVVAGESVAKLHRMMMVCEDFVGQEDEEVSVRADDKGV